MRLDFGAFLHSTAHDIQNGGRDFQNRSVFVRQHWHVGQQPFEACAPQPTQVRRSLGSSQFRRGHFEVCVFYCGYWWCVRSFLGSIRMGLGCCCAAVVQAMEVGASGTVGGLGCHAKRRVVRESHLCLNKTGHINV